MNRKHTILPSLLALAAVGLLFAGCAKKQTTPPTPPPAPAQPAPTETPVPPPAPPPAPVETPTTSPTGLAGGAEFAPVFFGFDSAALDATAMQVLDGNVRLLRDNPNVRVVIEGHADERGTVEYNLTLGERRADAAREYLVGAGIAPSRIETTSLGKSRPFATGSTEEAWAQNRRAHFVLR